MAGYLSVGKLTGKLEKKAESGKWRAEGNEKLASLSTIHYPLSTPFVIRTPTTTVTDLGTEFGVEVHDSGAVETQVFQGGVELPVAGADAGRTPTVVRPEHGTVHVEVGKDHVTTVRRMPAASAAFVRQLPRLKRVPIECSARASTCRKETPIRIGRSSP